LLLERRGSFPSGPFNGGLRGLLAESLGDQSLRTFQVDGEDLDLLRSHGGVVGADLAGPEEILDPCVLDAVGDVALAQKRLGERQLGRIARDEQSHKLLVGRHRALRAASRSPAE